MYLHRWVCLCNTYIDILYFKRDTCILDSTIMLVNRKRRGHTCVTHHYLLEIQRQPLYYANLSFCITNRSGPHSHQGVCSGGGWRWWYYSEGTGDVIPSSLPCPVVHEWLSGDVQ